MLILYILLIVLLFLQVNTLFGGQKLYYPFVNNGKQIAKTSKIILAMSLRDCESNIKSIHSFYKYFCKHFDQVKLVVMENNSKDKTRQRLLNLKKEGVDIDVVGCGLNAPVCNLQVDNSRTGCGKNRVRRMAYIRNILLDYIKQIQSSYDYCIVMDGDIKGRIETKGFLESIYYLKTRNDIDAIACYGLNNIDKYFLRQFYDGYAYEPEYGNQWFSQLLSHYMKGLVKVKSVFNGLVIYKLPFPDKLKYFEKTLTCEHISFHKHMNIYLNRDFLVHIDSH